MKFFFDYLAFLFIIYLAKLIDSDKVLVNSYVTSTSNYEEEVIIKRSPNRAVVNTNVNSQIYSLQKEISKLKYDKGIIMYGERNKGRGRKKQPEKGDKGRRTITRITRRRHSQQRRPPF